MLRFERAQYSVSKLIKMYNDNKLIIEHNPEDDAENNFNNTAIIEAILIGLPITIIAKQECNSKLKVISGNIKSVIDFCNNKIPLADCQVHSELNGKFYNDLNEFQHNCILIPEIQVIKLMCSTSDNDIQNLLNIIKHI